MAEVDIIRLKTDIRVHRTGRNHLSPTSDYSLSLSVNLV